MEIVGSDEVVKGTSDVYPIRQKLWEQLLFLLSLFDI